MVGLDGFEPSTSRLSGGRSNQLSYRPLRQSTDRIRLRILRLSARLGPEDDGLGHLARSPKTE